MLKRTDEEWGRIAYEAYVKDEMEQFENVGICTSTILGWEKIPPHGKDNWIKAATAVILSACADLRDEVAERMDES